MRPLSATTRDTLTEDEFMRRCCLHNDGKCSGPVQFHHNLIYAGKQSDEPWTILPVCSYHHSIEKQRDIGDRLDVIMLARASDADLSKYPRVNWQQKKRSLGFL